MQPAIVRADRRTAMERSARRSHLSGRINSDFRKLWQGCHSIWHQIGYLNRGWRQTRMPRGPQGQRRPADVIGAAVMVARIATGEISETLNPKSGRTRSRKAGGRDRAKMLTHEQ